MVYLQIAFVVIALLLFLWVKSLWAACIFGAILGFSIVNLLGAIANWVGVKVLVGEVNLAIDVCMRIGLHRTKIRFQELGGNRCLDFVKRNPAGRQTRFFMRLDRRRCSAAEFQAARDLLQAQGIEVEIKRDRKRKPRYLVVECDRDLEKAVGAARTLLTRVFGLSYDTKVRYIVDGGFSLRRHALIGWDREAGERKEATRGHQRSHESRAVVTKEGDEAAPSVGVRGKMLSVGRAEFDGKVFDVLCRGGMIAPGTEVEIVKIDGDRIVVQKVTETEEGDTNKE